jgi:hypothetical protein
MNTGTDTANSSVTGSRADATLSSDQASPGLQMHTLYLGSRGGRGFSDEDTCTAPEAIGFCG